MSEVEEEDRTNEISGSFDLSSASSPVRGRRDEYAAVVSAGTRVVLPSNGPRVARAGRNPPVGVVWRRLLSRRWQNLAAATLLVVSILTMLKLWTIWRRSTSLVDAKNISQFTREPPSLLGRIQCKHATNRNLASPSG